MTQDPFFSVIVPSYNRAHFIGKAINSLIGQPFADWEMLIVDDGSVDDTEAVVRSFTDRRIKYIRQANAERSVARNNGIDHASGKYLFFLDSDDFLEPGALDFLYKAIAINGFPVALFGIGALYRIGEKTQELPTLQTESTAEAILRANETIHVSQCAHKECFKNNRFDPRFTLWEDTHLWLRMLRQYPCIGVPDARISVVRHPESGVTQGLQKIRLQDVHRYRDAVLSLGNYPDIFPPETFGSILRNYVFSKYRMYIYQARMNRQYPLCATLLKESRQFGTGISYRLITGVKIGLGRFFHIHLP